MRDFIKNCYWLFLLTGILFACNPQEPVAQSENIGFIVNPKGEGSAFYTLDEVTGQLSYMLDFGEDAGNWRRYGNAYRKPERAGSTLFFQAEERGIDTGTTFYILNGATGQVSYLSDYGPGAGAWVNFGNRLKGANISAFDTQIIGTAGMVFYAYDSTAKQMYFMQDFGDKPGEWQKYGVDNN